MAHIEDELKTRCADAPSEPRQVIVTLRDGAGALSAAEFGLTEAEPIPYQPGMYRVCAPGAAVLRLSGHSDILDICADTEAQTQGRDQSV